MMDRVMIIGAGIGGLVAAHALRQRGIEAVVYEQVSTLRRVGAGLTLWHNALYVLDRLGLADQVIQSGLPLRHALIDTSDGRRLVESHPGELEAEMGVPAVGIHRAALHRVLLSGLPQESVCLGKKLVDIQQDAVGVVAVFEDGSQDRAGLLIGADGIHSTVRARLFPPVSLRYAGYAAWRGVARIPAQELETFALPRSTALECWGRGARFGMVWIGPDEVYWFATENVPAGRSIQPEVGQERLLGLFGGWREPVRRLIELTPTSEILYNDIIDFRPLPTWSSRRVTLLGDAAHATTPNMGQGACQAVESAAVLARDLAQHPRLEDALSAYEQARRSRAAMINSRSWQIGRVGQLSSPLLCSARDTLVRALSFMGSGALESAARYKAV